MQPLNIGEAADASGVSAKMIRHYEDLGLISKARRTASGYRIYTEADVHTLRFVRQARDLGFSIKQISGLLSLWHDRRRPSSKVKALALEHIRELDQKLLEMQSMKATLEHLVHCCHGDDRPECPILDRLSTEVGGNAADTRRPARRGGTLRVGQARGGPRAG
jgi:MerR family copper efflux transcriptional regulator